MHSIRFLLAISLLALLGCSAKHSETAADTPEVTTAKSQSQPQGVLTHAQKETLEKARQVDKLLQETQEKNLNKIDEMTDGKE
ncbi:MAG TPA: hypothetical protein VN030_11950 [Cellvibrio sp.]|nr:hypothetical protein [Cellvibrio sp.]